jgi:4-hydroxybenzoate polyprenyltransferase
MTEPFGLIPETHGPESEPSGLQARGRLPGFSLGAALKVLRLDHWVKNIIILFPVLFSRSYMEVEAWILASLATAAFCLTASAVYILNDIVDRRSDGFHPRKKDRPIASGALSVPAAGVEMLALLIGAGAVAWRLGARSVFVIAAYLLLQLAYSFRLKRKMIVDVICLAMGFVLRAIAGAVSIGAVISPWLIVCTFFLCLFLGFCKRHCEVVMITTAKHSASHRRTLVGYTPGLLNHMITLSATLAVASFMLYATSDRTMREFGTDYFIYTIPLVVYGIGRTAMLSMNGVYSGPTELLLSDWPIQTVCVLWAACAVVIVMYGRQLDALLSGA